MNSIKYMAALAATAAAQAEMNVYETFREAQVNDWHDYVPLVGTWFIQGSSEFGGAYVVLNINGERE